MVATGELLILKHETMLKIIPDNLSQWLNY